MYYNYWCIHVFITLMLKVGVFFLWYLLPGIFHITLTHHVLSATLPSFFQIKVDIPPECRIYPIESEDEEEETRAASRGGVGAKEIICPWESLTPQNGTG